MVARRISELLAFILLLSYSLTSFAERKVFLFGLQGAQLSLVREDSEYIPLNSRITPVKLVGHKRAWNIWVDDQKLRMSTPSDVDGYSGFINGVLYEVKERDLPKIDGLASWGFERIRVPLHMFRFYKDEDIAWFNRYQNHIDAYVFYPWRTKVRHGGTYLHDPSRHWDKKVPRSFLDVVLAGCAEIDNANNLGGAYLADCNSTMGLSGLDILEDRSKPVYEYHPANIFERSRQNSLKAESFLDEEWPRLLQQIGAPTPAQ
ncbi:hypothetical protein M3P05_16270 [Sansalvadorimonas sp. 2012CJ34-2]|uniref:Uncharacterized protein n=1 Tax=Parendozoicomonas callyspongiae TaxID=2942213 RepID=A0ABT0PL65_9GAMM|nr:hypothetical protein [Sansalvadorimonas sp. 2012CJ34-2]MCL6271477.1 hypothetical protein [Sansalvadorimonas sp. 2012CJ34-2]